MSLRKILIAGTAVAASVLLTTSTVLAAGDTDDHFSLAKGATVSGALKTGTNMVFKGTINGVPITVNCTSFSASGKIPATGLVVTVGPPAISGCTDSLGGTDTIKTNATNGTWKVSEIDLANDEAGTEPNSTGDRVKLTIPKAGASFSSTILSGCVVTAAPTAAVGVTGKYNDVSTDTVTNAKIAVSSTGCSAASPTTVSATVILSPSVHDVS